MTKQLDLLNDPVLGVLVSTGYVASLNHASLADIPVSCRVAFSGTLENRSVTGGVFNAYPAIASNVNGPDVTAIVLVSYNGTDISSPLIAFLDQSPDLPANPAGGDMVFNWDTTTYKIFAI